MCGAEVGSEGLLRGVLRKAAEGVLRGVVMGIAEGCCKDLFAFRLPLGRP